MTKQGVSWEQRTGAEWAQLYWAPTWLPHRTRLMHALDHLAPFDSVCEIGCGAGVNLRLIRERFNPSAFAGIDVNSELIRTGIRETKREGWTPVLLNGDVRTTPIPSLDIVFSCYTLAYIAPISIKRVLHRMLDAARIGVVVMEPMPEDGSAMSLARDEKPYEFAYDYRVMFDELKASRDIDSLWHISAEEAIEPIDRLNRFVVFHRTSSPHRAEDMQP